MPGFFSIRWKLVAAFFLISLVTILLAGIYLLRWTEDYYTHSVAQNLRKESRLVGSLIESRPSILPQDRLPALIKSIDTQLGYRISIIAPDGHVIADSEYNPAQMENHANRPEVREALSTGYGEALRYSSTLKIKMLYVATRFGPSDNPSGIARVSEPLSGLENVLGTIRKTFLTTAFIAIILAAILSMRIAAGIIGPVEEVSRAASRLAKGDMSARAHAEEKALDETGLLALTFNRMADELQSNINALTEQKERMQMVFDKTDDGLMLVDHQTRIRMINPAACTMLSIECSEILGKTTIEGTLNHDLAALTERVTRTGEPAALEISPATGEGTFIHCYVAPLQSQSGALVVLHDVTGAKQLDAIRRDFVANVSHELRTPLASIKAMAETILLRYKSDPQTAPQFAQSIVDEADRMTLLAEDLLDLARIESGRRTLRPESLDLHALVNTVIERIAPTAERNAIKLVSEVPQGEVIIADRDALVQLLVNLVDNGVKYNREGGSVTVSSGRVNGSLAVSVADTGIGIPQEELTRIFERFYRIDKARSRESGGTGLGLSIVKHLADSMGGRITIASEVDKGTTFTFTLPQS